MKTSSSTHERAVAPSPGPRAVTRSWWRRCRRAFSSPRLAWHRLLREAIDFWTLFFLPGLPALLPWRLAWACYRAVSRFPVLLPALLAARADIAVRTLPGTDRRRLLRRMRFLQLLDFADLYLVRRARLSAPPAAHFTVEGEWPGGPFIAVSFHYGNGLWMLRDLLRKGRRTTVVAAPFEPGDYKGQRIHLAYARTRHREMERSAGAAAAYRPGVREKLVHALAQGEAVMSLLDLPPRLVSANQRPVALLGQRASLPIGVFQLAAALKVPLVPFWIEIDRVGIRKLVIERARDAQDVAANLTYFAALLDELVRRDPAAWYFWSEWPAWQRDAAALFPP
jgi:hypothetical protein